MLPVPCRALMSFRVLGPRDFVMRVRWGWWYVEKNEHTRFRAEQCRGARQPLRLESGLAARASLPQIRFRYSGEL